MKFYLELIIYRMKMGIVRRVEWGVQKIYAHNKKEIKCKTMEKREDKMRKRNNNRKSKC